MSWLAFGRIWIKLKWNRRMFICQASQALRFGRTPIGPSPVRNSGRPWGRPTAQPLLLIPHPPSLPSLTVPCLLSLNPPEANQRPVIAPRNTWYLPAVGFNCLVALECRYAIRSLVSIARCAIKTNNRENDITLLKCPKDEWIAPFAIDNPQPLKFRCKASTAEATKLWNGTKFWIICHNLRFVNRLELWKGLVRTSIHVCSQKPGEDFIIES